MSKLNEILDHNKNFVESKKYEQYETTKYPDKKMVILSCMDTRLSDLLPKAMNVGQGDAKIVKNAGAIVSHPFGSIMRSILVALYGLNASEVYVVGHHDCGMTGMRADPILKKAKEHEVTDEVINVLRNSGIDIDGWLKGVDNVEDAVQDSVNMIKNHPLFPAGVAVHGLIIDPSTGKLDLVVDGNENK